MPQSRWIQFHKQKLIDVNAQIKVSTTKVGDFSTPFLLVDKSSQQKIDRQDRRDCSAVKSASHSSRDSGLVPATTQQFTTI